MVVCAVCYQICRKSKTELFAVDDLHRTIETHFFFFNNPNVKKIKNFSSGALLTQIADNGFTWSHGKWNSPGICKGFFIIFFFFLLIKSFSNFSQ